MTFTLLAADPAGGLLGAATSSKSLAVGRSVPAIDPTAGAAASQAWSNSELRHHMLAALGEGKSPQQAVATICELDAGLAHRQVGVLDRTGTAAVHTGERTLGWAGHLSGEHHVALGNCLTGPEVLTAMSEAFAEGISTRPGQLDPVLEFAQLMVSALQAAEAAGGDARGRESAALMVASTTQRRLSPPELGVDLRVDHHRQPVEELRMLLLRSIAEADAGPTPGMQHPENTT